jgi:hypothetical protein
MRAMCGLALLLSVAGGLAAQPSEAERIERFASEPNLEKRSKLALDYAHDAVGRVEEAYADADPERAREILTSIVSAVAISQASLEDTGKNARKKPKHFKRAEIGSRKLLKELQSLERTLTFDERQDLAPVIAQLEDINRDLLLKIMQHR